MTAEKAASDFYVGALCRSKPIYLDDCQTFASRHLILSAFLSLGPKIASATLSAFLSHPTLTAVFPRNSFAFLGPHS